jgi:multidrug efflux pump subunit AcrA (membrane-fusion protein)
MNCPFCGTNLAKVAAICSSCKIQLPEQRLFTYYAAALDRDKSLAQPEKRSKLDAIVEKEAEARAALLQEAKERARAEELRLKAEWEASQKQERLRQAAASEAARIQRSQFMSENRKKIQVSAIAGVIVIAGVVGVGSYLKPEPPKAPKANAPQIEVKLEPCIALGTATRELNLMLNETLALNSDDGLSELDIVSLGNSARVIQSKLLGTTNGQTAGYPKLEEAILRLANSLGTYSNSLKGLDGESEILKKATDPISWIAVDGQRACKSAGFVNQFNDASGWEK